MLRWPLQDQSTGSNSNQEISTRLKPNKKQIAILIIKWTLIATIVGIITFFILFGIDFNHRLSLRDSFASVRPESGPLSSYNCFANFDNGRLNQHYGIIPSVPVIEDDVCFEYAALIKPNKKYRNNATRISIFHTFWSSKQHPQGFDDTQLEIVRSFVATQAKSTLLMIWISASDQKKVESSKAWQKIDSNQVRLKAIEETDYLQSETPLQHASEQGHKQVIQQSDQLLLLMVLYKYGGVWFDFQAVFVRDMSPLLHQEWTSQWHCSESMFATAKSINSRFKGKFLHFYPNSPYLCEMMAEASEQLLVNKKVLGGPELYARIYDRLMKHRLPVWAVLPWCFTHPSECKKSNSLQKVFVNKDGFDMKKLNRIFAFHWKQATRSQSGSIFKYLATQHKKITSW